MTDTEPGTAPAPMTSTDRQGLLFGALAVAQANARSVDKDSKNEFHKYKYASAEALIREAKESLAVAGLAVMPMTSRIVPVEKEPFGAIENKGGAVGMLKASWMIVHGGGGSMELSLEWPIVPEKGRPIDKAVAAAHTASLGYLLRDLLQLPRVEEGTGLDDDSRDREREERRAEKPQERPAKAAPKISARDVEMAVKSAVMAELSRLKVGDGLTPDETKKALVAEVNRLGGGKAPTTIEGWEAILTTLKATPNGGVVVTTTRDVERAMAALS